MLHKFKRNVIKVIVKNMRVHFFLEDHICLNELIASESELLRQETKNMMY